jgi:hypothetical protein
MLTVPFTESYYGTSSSIVTTVVSEYKVLAPLIDIRWQAADKSTSKTKPSNQGPQGTSLGPETSKASSGLSTGAQAGIGVGVAVIVIAILAGAFFFWRRKRSSSHTPPPETKHEIQCNPVHEMDNRQSLLEAKPQGYLWHDNAELRGDEPERFEVHG